MIAPPLDAQRPTRGIRARARAQSAQARPLAPALAARATCSCTPARHSSSSRLDSGQFCVQPCCALRKRCESARPEHWDRHTTGAPTATYAARHGATPGRTNVFPAACGSQPHRAAERLRVPPRARPAANSCRLAGGSPCRAGVLRWRTTRVAARPPRGELASRHEPRSRQPTPSRPSDAALPPPFLSLEVMIIGQPQGQLYGVRLGQAQQPALCRREPCSQHETRKGNRVKRSTLPCGMTPTALAERPIASVEGQRRGGQRDGQTPITQWPTRRACGACQQVKVRALVSAAKSADEAV